MITREELMGDWNRIKGRIRQTWGQLTDDDLQKAQGNFDQLVGTIQQKTGVAHREIEQFLSSIMSEAASVTGQMANAARDYASASAEAFSDGYQAAQRKAEDLSRQVATTVSYRPFESLALAFGIGIAAGLLFSMSRRTA